MERKVREYVRRGYHFVVGKQDLLYFTLYAHKFIRYGRLTRFTEACKLARNVVHILQCAKGSYFEIR